MTVFTQQTTMVIMINILSVGCLLAGVFIVATGYTQQRRTSVIFLVLGVGFSGLNAIGYAVNHLDIGPPFAGILMGLTNTFASTPGFISPQITGFVTSNKVRELSFAKTHLTRRYRDDSEPYVNIYFFKEKKIAG